MPLVVISQVDDKTGTGGERQEKRREKERNGDSGERTEGATGASVLDRSAGEPKPEQTPDGDWTGSRLRRHSRVAKERRVGLDTPPPFSPSSGAAKRWAKAAGPAEPRRHTTLKMR
uniref:Uncharacterized protein n=1 Tax=Knipowitschia caucasica TaxID=637954 RepID=A0AAV2J185_KNICA